MSFITRHRIAATVTASGGASQAYYTSAVVNGYLVGIVVSKPLTSGVSTGANILITDADSSQVLLNVTSTNATNSIVSYYPRALTQTNAGALLGAATGAGAVVGIPDRLAIAEERIKVQFTSAGTASAGGLRATLDFYIEGR